jgi:TetR/AcrR family transcriptional regulator, lmrAB and yxaGH operons repressor
MPAPLISKAEVLERVMNTFRESGYDGASLAELSERTGLGKSSLYHYFPGGKEDMAEQVLAHLASQLEQALFAPLALRKAPQAKLDALLDALDAFYDGGRKACLLERLAASVRRERFQQPLSLAFERWLGAVEALGREAGLPRSVAKARAEELVMRVEGALVVCAGTGETAYFARTLRALRTLLRSPPELR